MVVPLLYSTCSVSGTVRHCTATTTHKVIVLQHKVDRTGVIPLGRAMPVRMGNNSYSSCAFPSDPPTHHILNTGAHRLSSLAISAFFSGDDPSRPPSVSMSISSGVMGLIPNGIWTGVGRAGRATAPVAAIARTSHLNVVYRGHGQWVCVCVYPEAHIRTMTQNAGERCFASDH